MKKEIPQYDSIRSSLDRIIQKVDNATDIINNYIEESKRRIRNNNINKILKK